MIQTEPPGLHPLSVAFQDALFLIYVLWSLFQVLQAQGWEKEETRLKEQVKTQDVRISELEVAIENLSADLKESRAAVNESKEQYAALEKKYHKAKKLIKELQEK